VIAKPNPYYPLPADYDTLTMEGQRQARVHTLQDQDTPEKLVERWNLFRRLYLCTVGESFYKGGFQESPEFHGKMVYDLGAYGRNAVGAPRGSAKSMVIGTEVPLFFTLTRPYYETMLALATDRLVEDRFDKINTQLTENKYILDDFGKMKPKRGRAIWNRHHMHCVNGSVLKGISVMGKKRGGRPQLFILDDPENDPDSEAQESSQILLEKFERILFRQVIPMLEHGSAIFWIGTLINRRSFLYHATCMDDPRFNQWNRRVYKAITYDAKGGESKVQVLWESKWPAAVLEARREEIGDSAFHAEYLNDPVSDTERVLVIDPRRNEYTVTGEIDSINPISAPNTVHWFDRVDTTGEETKPQFIEQEKSFSELVAPMFRVATFDYAQGMNKFNDYSCLGIFGFDHQNTLWILDMWMGRAKESTLLKIIYEKSKAWQVRIIGIETASVQISFKEAVEEYVQQQAEQTTDRWRARVFPVKYPSNTSKAQRIAGLEWRFRPGRIKYPAHLSGTYPFDHLYMQTADFTPDLALLVKDDAIDTVAMTQYVIKTKGSQTQIVDPVPSLKKRIMSGKSVVAGMPLLSGVGNEELSEEYIEMLIDKKLKSAMMKGRERYRHERPKVYGRRTW
jgi:hypothetical protein